MQNLAKNLEQVFVDATMAEAGCDLLSLSDDLKDMTETFECSLVDVTFAEEGEFTETACAPRYH